MPGPDRSGTGGPLCSGIGGRMPPESAEFIFSAIPLQMPSFSEILLDVVNVSTPFAAITVKSASAEVMSHPPIPPSLYTMGCCRRERPMQGGLDRSTERFFMLSEGEKGEFIQ